jgi:hypothetical protein
MLKRIKTTDSSKSDNCYKKYIRKLDSGGIMYLGGVSIPNDMMCVHLSVDAFLYKIVKLTMCKT